MRGRCIREWSIVVTREERETIPPPEPLSGAD